MLIKTLLNDLLGLTRPARRARRPRPGLERLELRDVPATLAPPVTFVNGHMAFIANDGPGKVAVFEDGVKIGGDHQQIRGFLFSPDGRHLAIQVTDNNRTAVIEDGKFVGGYHDMVTDLKFSPVGNHLAFIAIDGPGVAARAMVIEDGLVVGVPHVSVYSGLVGPTFSPDGRHLAYATFDAPGADTLVVDGKVVTSRHTFGGFAFSPDSQHLAVFVNDGANRMTVLLDPGTPLFTNRTGNHQAIGFFGFSPDSRHLVTVVEDNGRFGVLQDGVAVGGPAIHVGISALQYSPDGKHLAFVTQDPAGFSVLEDGQAVGGAHSSVVGLQYSPDSRHLAFVAFDTNGLGSGVVKDGVVVFRSIGSGPNLVGIAPSDPGKFFRFSPDSQHLAFAATKSATNQQAVVMDGAVVGGLHKTVTGAQFSSTSHLAFVTTDTQGTTTQVRVVKDGAVLGGTYSVVAGNGVAVGNGAPASPNAAPLVFSPDGNHLAWFAADPGFRAVHVVRDGVNVEGTHPLVPPGAIPGVNALLGNTLRFSADGRHLAWFAPVGAATAVVVDDQVVGGTHQRISDLLFGPLLTP